MGVCRNTFTQIQNIFGITEGSYSLIAEIFKDVVEAQSGTVKQEIEERDGNVTNSQRWKLVPEANSQRKSARRYVSAIGVLFAKQADI